MSTLIAYVLGKGVIFAADKNITVSIGGTPSHQIPGRKVLRWPNGDALVGYVGAASVASGQDIDLWLQDFIDRNPTVSSPSAVAHALSSDLQAAMNPAAPKRLIVQFAAFEKRNGVTVPEYWHIANVPGMDLKTGHYHSPTAIFGCSEELLGHWASGIAPAQLRTVLQAKADAYDPQWFHHSFELGIFNWLEAGAKAAFKSLQNQGLISKPIDLADWEKHATFWVLQFASYIAAFYPSGQQYVGGGVDVLSIPWP